VLRDEQVERARRRQRPPAGAGGIVVSRVREVIPDVMAGERVDKVVALLTGLARSDVANLVDAGGVVLAGRPVQSRSRKVQTGQMLEIDVPEPGTDTLVPDPSVPLTVVFEDADVVVVDKPAGLVVHPGSGHRSGTLVHGLLARYPELAGLADVDDTDGAERPGIVHRLDAGTSGLLVVARTPAARRSLVAQLAARAVDRRYWGLVWGHVEAPAGQVDAPIGRDDRDPTRMAVRIDGREARTGYEVLQRFDRPSRATLVECRLETGRTHQIRVHLAAIGHPVVGDNRYGGARRTRGPLALDRPFLHAHHLAFVHPVSGRDVVVDSVLPADLERVRAALA
jgi:23S rRNA pseudouridine1911/1915/1917 synthase